MTTTGGSVVHQARFLPFGGTRGWGSAPTAAWLDRGYTGHPSASSGHACTMMGNEDGSLNTVDPLIPLLPPPLTPIFDGLPIASASITWANGFGANSFAQTYGDPNSSDYRSEYINSGGLHPGLDFFASAGTPVYSNVSGVIQLPSPYPGDAGRPVINGNPSNVVILLDNGMFVIFGHVTGIDGLAHGMRIEPGQLIGTVADQDNNSHVHLALRQSISGRERVYNPANYFTDASVLNGLPWSGYTANENLHSMSSFLYQPSDGRKNFWMDGALAVGVTR